MKIMIYLVINMILMEYQGQYCGCGVSSYQKRKIDAIYLPFYSKILKSQVEKFVQRWKYMIVEEGIHSGDRRIDLMKISVKRLFTNDEQRCPDDFLDEENINFECSDIPAEINKELVDTLKINDFNLEEMENIDLFIQQSTLLDHYKKNEKMRGFKREKRKREEDEMLEKYLKEQERKKFGKANEKIIQKNKKNIYSQEKEDSNQNQQKPKRNLNSNNKKVDNFIFDYLKKNNKLKIVKENIHNDRQLALKGFFKLQNYICNKSFEFYMKNQCQGTLKDCVLKRFKKMENEYKFFKISIQVRSDNALEDIQLVEYILIFEIQSIVVKDKAQFLLNAYFMKPTSIEGQNRDLLIEKIKDNVPLNRFLEERSGHFSKNYPSGKDTEKFTDQIFKLNLRGFYTSSGSWEMIQSCYNAMNGLRKSIEGVIKLMINPSYSINSCPYGRFGFQGVQIYENFQWIYYSSKLKLGKQITYLDYKPTKIEGVPEKLLFYQNYYKPSKFFKDIFYPKIRYSQKKVLIKKGERLAFNCAHYKYSLENFLLKNFLEFKYFERFQDFYIKCRNYKLKSKYFVGLNKIHKSDPGILYFKNQNMGSFQFIRKKDQYGTPNICIQISSSYLGKHYSSLRCQKQTIKRKDRIVLDVKLYSNVFGFVYDEFFKLNDFLGQIENENVYIYEVNNFLIRSLGKYFKFESYPNKTYRSPDRIENYGYFFNLKNHQVVLRVVATEGVFYEVSLEGFYKKFKIFIPKHFKMDFKNINKTLEMNVKTLRNEIIKNLNESVHIVKVMKITEETRMELNQRTQKFYYELKYQYFLDNYFTDIKSFLGDNLSANNTSGILISYLKSLEGYENQEFLQKLAKYFNTNIISFPLFVAIFNSFWHDLDYERLDISQTNLNKFNQISLNQFDDFIQIFEKDTYYGDGGLSSLKNWIYVESDKKLNHIKKISDYLLDENSILREQDLITAFDSPVNKLSLVEFDFKYLGQKQTLYNNNYASMVFGKSEYFFKIQIKIFYQEILSLDIFHIQIKSYFFEADHIINLSDFQELIAHSLILIQQYDDHLGKLAYAYLNQKGETDILTLPILEEMIQQIINEIRMDFGVKIKMCLEKDKKTWKFKMKMNDLARVKKVTHLAEPMGRRLLVLNFQECDDSLKYQDVIILTETANDINVKISDRRTISKLQEIQGGEKLRKEPLFQQYKIRKIKHFKQQLMIKQMLSKMIVTNLFGLIHHDIVHSETFNDDQLKQQ